MTKFGGAARSSRGFGSNRRSEKLHRKEILRIYFPKNNQRTTGALFVSSALDAISGGFHAKAGLVPRANLVEDALIIDTVNCIQKVYQPQVLQRSISTKIMLVRYPRSYGWSGAPGSVTNHKNR